LLEKYPINQGIIDNMINLVDSGIIGLTQFSDYMYENYTREFKVNGENITEDNSVSMLKYMIDNINNIKYLYTMTNIEGNLGGSANYDFYIGKTKDGNYLYLEEYKSLTYPGIFVFIINKNWKKFWNMGLHKDIRTILLINNGYLSPLINGYMNPLINLSTNLLK
jgi:hypothetical protein